uniref:C2H2-type domain-containing protein n=1 Tax=Megaselia scalaris TaxID=36166 RepID=T1GKV9_MEGSC
MHSNYHRKDTAIIMEGFQRFRSSEEPPPRKREEIIRHLKWHKKRIESINFGFMRFSASDDCSRSFPAPPPLFKDQKTTHFHCIRDTCKFTFKNKADIVVAHRKHHEKHDSVKTSGFIKISQNESCFLNEDNDRESEEGGNPAECVHSLKQTHYHCETCSGVVLSKSLIPIHRHKE